MTIKQFHFSEVEQLKYQNFQINDIQISEFSWIIYLKGSIDNLNNIKGFLSFYFFIFIISQNFIGPDLKYFTYCISNVFG